MANMFALMLAGATLATGIIWCFERFRWAAMRQAKIATTTTPAPNDVAVGAKISAKPAKLVAAAGWTETCASVFPVLALVFVVRSFIYEPFQIPSGSMMPTLLVGDFILVEKYAYGIKNPITQTTLIATKLPKRGDTVVFKYPLNPRLDYIKRVVGLPGDRVTYDPVNKQAIVQPRCRPDESCNKASAVTYSRPTASDFVQIFQHEKSDKPTSNFLKMPEDILPPANGLRLMQRTETQDTTSHSILTAPAVQDQSALYYQQHGLPEGVWLVPEGHYFVMGDNRDNSADSRFWGFVPEKNLVGKATAIWMSFEKQEGEWPTGVRLSRIGGIH